MQPAADRCAVTGNSETVISTPLAPDAVCCEEDSATLSDSGSVLASKELDRLYLSDEGTCVLEQSKLSRYYCITLNIARYYNENKKEFIEEEKYSSRPYIRSHYGTCH